MADPFDTPGYRFASQTFAGDGSTIDWNFSFAGRSPGYISVDHVRAELIDDTTGEVTTLVLTPEQFVLPTRLRIEPAVPVGTTLRVWRDTPKDQPMLDYTDGALMIEKNLDTSNEQVVYATAEMVDRFANALDDTAEFSQAVLDRLGEVETTANQAADDAQDAVNTANAATATAQGAVNTANAAVETAADALAGVEGATIAAQQATEAAEAANLAADTANQAVIDVTAIAATAEQNASDALSVANGIDAKAQAALDNSELAITTAAAAETTANGIAGTAASAVTIAEAAADDAEEALTTANGIASTAADALTAAGEAQTAADNAQDTANDALARAEISLPVYSSRPSSNVGPIVYVQGLGVQYWNGSAYRSDWKGDPLFPTADWPVSSMDTTISNVSAVLRPGGYRATTAISGLPAGWTAATLWVEMYNDTVALVTATCYTPSGRRGEKATRVYVNATTPSGWSVTVGARSEWLMQPIGVPIPLWDHIAGVSLPPTDDPRFRYIKLTADDDYNDGVLTDESVTGSAPLVQATAVIDLEASPLHGQTIHLINTERRALRAGESGIAQEDAFQGHWIGTSTGALGDFDLQVSSGGTQIGAMRATSTPKATPLSDGVNGTPRTANETRMKNIGATFLMRIM